MAKSRVPLVVIATLFLKLGVIGFGGPAAHIALMQREVVARRKWLTDQQFLDLLGLTNLIPGPNSTEMAILVGRRMRGAAGLVIAGLCFIVPAAVMVLTLAIVYVEYGDTPGFEDVLYGIVPVIVAVVVHALFRLARTAVRSIPAGAIVAISLFLYLVGVHELLLLLGGALAGVGASMTVKLSSAAFVPWLPMTREGWVLGVASVDASLDRLFLTFLKIGAVLYGSGYVLLALLRRDLVVELGWLTNEQLLDAIAIGQVTPGPVFTTATFVGYVVAGLSGALLATVAIFLPAFLFAAAGDRLLQRLEGSAVVRGLLDGLNAVAVALIAGVLVELADSAWTDALTVLLSVAALIVLLVRDVNSIVLVAAGGTIGVATGLL